MKWQLVTISLAMTTLIACDQEEAYRKREWEGPCKDESTLLATTAGSPNRFECSNKLHRMHVQVATTSSNEEAAALVFCECVRDEPLKIDAGVP